jgi:hippurate hydrolase
MPVINRIGGFAADMAAWRQALHRRPELLLETPETAAFVIARLQSFGVDEIHSGIAGHGIVALIRGRGDSPERTALRADMDALPITEARDPPWKSEIPGRMHACGHDGHTAMLLGAARYLAETRDFAGQAVLIFQPGEEGAAGGRLMVEAGIMERFGITRVFALHNWPNLEEGRFALCNGPAMAAADVFEITVTGRGAHAAYPHLSVDPVNAAMQLGLALQSLVSREVDPLDQVVLSVTTLAAGSVHNVIPNTARLTGTVRTLDERTRQAMKARIERMVVHLPGAFGASASLDYQFGYPVTVNDGAAAAFAAGVAADVAGAGRVASGRPPEMGAEDFSFMLQRRPGAYVLLGQGPGAGLHHPDYDFNDAVAPVGASFFARLVELAQPAA